MNFQTITPVDPSTSFLDYAFRKAREKGTKKLRGDRLQILKKKESLKLDVIKDNLVQRLNKILETFPKENELPHFYVRMLHLTLDYPLYKKSLGAVYWAVGKVRRFQKDYVGKINRAKEYSMIKPLSKQFYGRISSIMKQIGQNLKYLEKCRRTMRTYPDIKEMFTVCIYGFPNVGKTTLLNKLCGSKAKVAAYAFTTVSINAGYLGKGDHKSDQKVQILDVPGTLARKEKMNNIELQAELVMEELADLVIYVFDLSGYCGYSVAEQEILFKKIKKLKTRKILIYIAKQDLIGQDILQDFMKKLKQKHYSIPEIKEKLITINKKSIAKDNLKDNSIN